MTEKELKKEIKELVEEIPKAKEVKVEDSLSLVQDKLLETKKLNDDLEAEQMRSEELRDKQM